MSMLRLTLSHGAPIAPELKPKPPLTVAFSFGALIATRLMNIYAISWSSFGGFGLNAAVVAENETAAVQLLHFSDGEAQDLEVRLVGMAHDGLAAQVFAHESL